MTSQKIKQKVQIVVTANDKILLLKLNENRGGIWQNATGAVEKNETFKEAAARELLEETGIKQSVAELPLEITFHDRFGYDVIEKVFHCHLKQLPVITISVEHQDFKWVNFQNLNKSDYEFANHFKAAVLATEALK